MKASILLTAAYSALIASALPIGEESVKELSGVEQISSNEAAEILARATCPAPKIPDCGTAGILMKVVKTKFGYCTIYYCEGHDGGGGPGTGPSERSRGSTSEDSDFLEREVEAEPEAELEDQKMVRIDTSIAGPKHPY